MFLAQKKRELITIDSHVLSVTSCKVSHQFLIVFSVAFGAFQIFGLVLLLEG